ncbi:MAG: 16S rRNA (cytosine(1402)-N(4))-methyltransferase RsmH [Oscillospiraceae bacterium]|nr:16S rRNA (cytosine(1402)-N(4))-methyltransferase RsmH [Oscillospiraceae bacterium]
MNFQHKPIMLKECIDGLSINPNGIYVDGTVGGAGHSFEIASLLSAKGKLIGFDKDPDAVMTASERLKDFKNARVFLSDYSDAANVLRGMSVDGINGVLLDLGVSSYQLDTPERGFSYRVDAPLDMRMSQTGKSAADVVNTYSKEDLERIIRENSEERFAYRIADLIVKEREKKPIETTGELSEIISRAVPAFSKREKNPSKRTFQAIRMEVNEELQHLSDSLDSLFDILLPGGRFAVITFHSLEDRMVKERFNTFSTGCTCPPDFPICVCGKKPRGRLINRKPITADEEELERNPRAKSAKLRIIEKL